MSFPDIFVAILVMAAVTYATRVIPFLLFRSKIKNRFIQSFLLYMPYGVLAAMVFPGIFFSTESLISAIAGAIVALWLSYYNKGLLPVSICATVTVFLTERLLTLF